MKKYPKMKPSGVEWIGDVPEHWDLKRAQFSFEYSKNLVKTQNLSGRAVFHYSIPNVQEFYDSILEEGDEIDSDKFLVEGGEILISKLNPRKNTVILAQKKEIDTVCSTEFLPLKPKLYSEKFAYYLLSCSNLAEFLNSAVESVTRSHQRVKPDTLLKQVFQVPLKTEQLAIAHYLDRKTAQIDQSITEKERLIELFREERQAIINHAVTKGIREGVKMKASGVEWIGEMPEGWAVKKLKYVVLKIGSGITPKGGSEVYQTEGIPLLRSQNIHFQGLKLEDVAFITEEVHNSMSNSKVLSGDVLLNITGASIGRCYFYEGQLGEVNVNQHVCIVRPNEKIQTRYLTYFLVSEIGQLQIELSQTGSGREGLNFESLKNFTLPLPPIAEQAEVVKTIDQKTTQIDTAISGIQQEIALLQEYRQALIFEAVTGKVDVRETTQN